MTLKQSRQKREQLRLAILRAFHREKKNPNICSQEYPQKHSTFFSILPPEIRLMIYSHAYPYKDQLIHIARRYHQNQRLGHVECQAESGWDPSLYENDEKDYFGSWGVRHTKCLYKFNTTDKPYEPQNSDGEA